MLSAALKIFPRLLYKKLIESGCSIANKTKSPKEDG
jgi:hypothetical protein